jgi:hypothetical protein
LSEQKSILKHDQFFSLIIQFFLFHFIMSNNNVTRINTWTDQPATKASSARVTRTPVTLLNNFMTKNTTTTTTFSAAEPDSESTPVTKINNYIRAPVDEDQDVSSLHYRSDPVRPFTAPIQWTAPNTNFPILHHMKRRNVIGNHR